MAPALMRIRPLSSKPLLSNKPARNMGLSRKHRQELESP